MWICPNCRREFKRTNLGHTISFSACKNHISFYVGAETIKEFTSELNEFVTKKNVIYFNSDINCFKINGAN